MKRILRNKALKTWAIRLAIAFVASQITGMGMGYCLAGYFLCLFLFDFAARLFCSLIGMALTIVLALALFIGFLTL